MIKQKLTVTITKMISITRITLLWWVIMIMLHRSGLSIAIELRMLSLSRLCFLYRAHQKSKPLGKIRYLCNCRKIFLPNLWCLQRRIWATHCGNFVAIFGCVQKL